MGYSLIYKTCHHHCYCWFQFVQNQFVLKIYFEIMYLSLWLSRYYWNKIILFYNAKKSVKNITALVCIYRYFPFVLFITINLCIIFLVLSILYLLFNLFIHLSNSFFQFILYLKKYHFFQKKKNFFSSLWLYMIVMNVFFSFRYR